MPPPIRLSSALAAAPRLRRDSLGFRRTTAPQSPGGARVHRLSGADSHRLGRSAASTLRERCASSAEMAELYWMSLARDVPFFDYGSSPLIERAALELSGLSDFRGPRFRVRSHRKQSFRATSWRDRRAYVSQFLLQPFAFGAQLVEQRIRTLRERRRLPHVFFPTGSRVRMERGSERGSTTRLFATIRNGRDLAAW